MMKRTIILSLLGLMTAVSSMAQETFYEGDFRYLPAGAGTVSVDSCTLDAGSMAIIPETITHEGKPYTVTAIGDKAFYYSKLAAIYIPNTVTSIGTGAFYQCAATFIRLSPNATAIGAGAFASCQALGHLDLPDGLKRLGNGILNSTPLYTIGKTTLPQLTSVGGAALNGTHLQHFPLTDAVTSLGEYAFSDCSYLQDIHLPAGMTEIPEGLFDGCTSLTQVELPAGITRIGAYAFSNCKGLTSIIIPEGVISIGSFTFTGSGIQDIDLSQYQGSIGFKAFNDCNDLDRLTLPADNPYCYTSEDGKVLYDREHRDLLSVLPTVECLIIPYPATGGETALVRGPLSGLFDNLKELELPHSWTAYLGDCNFPALQTLTMRMPTFQTNSIPRGLPYASNSDESCDIYVFNYAMNSLIEAWGNSGYLNRQQNAETKEYSYVNLHAIDRPTEQLYMAEVLPMYDNLNYVEGSHAVIWNADWNAAIEEAFPQYFTAENIASSKKDYKSLFRNYMAKQYMDPAHFWAFKGEGAESIPCIDGKLHLATGFDAGNYTNWYLNQNFIPAKDFVPDSDPLSLNYVKEIKSGTRLTGYQSFAADPAWQQPIDEYGLLYGYSYSPYEEGNQPDVTGSYYPSATYALHMVPGVSYNIYAIVPPRHPLSNEETTYKNKLRTNFTSVTGLNETTGAAQTSKNTVNTEILYESGKVESLLLYENVQVLYDVYNLLEVTSSNINTSLREQGYTTVIPLIGILCEPQTEFERYPDAVEGMAAEPATVVARYDLQGRRITSMTKGVHLLRMSDGTTRKVLRK